MIQTKRKLTFRKIRIKFYVKTKSKYFSKLEREKKTKKKKMNKWDFQNKLLFKFQTFCKFPYNYFFRFFNLFLFSGKEKNE